MVHIYIFNCDKFFSRILLFTKIHSLDDTNDRFTKVNLAIQNILPPKYHLGMRAGENPLVICGGHCWETFEGMTNQAAPA